jgi:DNA-binding NtrC family response regulator
MESQSDRLSYPSLPILLLDDEPHFRSAIVRELSINGITNVISSDDIKAARELVVSNGISLVLLDLNMPEASGEELLIEYLGLAPQIPIIIVTGSTDTATIVQCIKAGALDYLTKPIENQRLITSIRNSLAISELRQETKTFQANILKGLAYSEPFKKIITADTRMLMLFKYIEAISHSRNPVLIVGETGVGKELIARAIHDTSQCQGSFIAVNLGGLDDTVLSDTLFGHKKGAYTGADSERPGLIDTAKKGTLFLDEIGDLDNHSQVKLLRLLQEREYYPLGSDTVLHSEARIVAATTKNLTLAVASGSFRADLYYRLQTHLIEVPPLRERRQDINVLIDYFIERSAESLGKPKSILIKPECRTALAEYDFPGNIRELESIIHDAVTCSSGTSIDTQLVLSRISQEAADTMNKSKNRNIENGNKLCLIGGSFPTIQEAELELAQMAFLRTAGNINLAASLLGVSQQKMSKLIDSRKSS